MGETMSQVDMRDFAPELSTDAATEVWNTLPYSYLDFAKDVTLYSRVYGVLTGAQEGPERQDMLSYVLNSCARSALIRLLREVVSATELAAGYTLSERYVVEDHIVPSDGKGQLDLAGVESVNVKREWYDADDIGTYEDIEVHYYVILDATVDVAGSKAYVQLPIDVVDNPWNALVRDRNSQHGYTYAQDEPVTRESGSPDYWKVPINTSVRSYAPGDTIDVQHRQYAYVDLTPSLTLPEGAVLEPVYPGTNQIIPQAKPMEVLDSGDYRYWFYVYTLVLPSFTHRTVDLLSPELYKMFPTIDFKYWVEEAAYPELWVTTGYDQEALIYDPLDPDVEGTPVVTLVDGYHGVYHANTDTCSEVLNSWCLATNCVDRPITARIRIYYKVNPESLPKKLLSQVPMLLRAILYRIAADIPVGSCGCPIDFGFIYEQQMNMVDVVENAYTGQTTTRFRHGTRAGQIEYSKILETVTRHTRLTVI
jgi:hypothetical protein